MSTQNEDREEPVGPGLALADQLEANSGLSRWSCVRYHKHSEGGECLGSLNLDSVHIVGAMKEMDAQRWVSSLGSKDQHLSGED